MSNTTTESGRTGGSVALGGAVFGISCGERAGAPESGGSGAAVLSFPNIRNHTKAGADMGMIIYADELLEHETFVELVLTTDEIEATIATLSDLDIDRSQRDTLTSAVASMNFAHQRAKTAMWRRQLAEDLLDRARAAR